MWQEYEYKITMISNKKLRFILVRSVEICFKINKIKSTNQEKNYPHQNQNK